MPKRRLKLHRPQENRSGFFAADGEIEVGIGACHDLHPSEVQNIENIFSVYQVSANRGPDSPLAVEANIKSLCPK